MDTSIYINYNNFFFRAKKKYTNKDMSKTRVTITLMFMTSIRVLWLKVIKMYWITTTGSKNRKTRVFSIAKKNMTMKFTKTYRPIKRAKRGKKSMEL